MFIKVAPSDCSDPGLFFKKMWIRSCISISSICLRTGSGQSMEPESAAKPGMWILKNTYWVCFGEDVRCWTSAAAAGDTRLRVRVSGPASENVHLVSVFWSFSSFFCLECGISTNMGSSYGPRHVLDSFFINYIIIIDFWWLKHDH